MMNMNKFFEKYKNLHNTIITAEILNNLNYYIEQSWYLQIIKQYGIIFVLIILEYFKSVENYIECQKICSSIDDSNIHFGTCYSSNIEDYGKM